MAYTKKSKKYSSYNASEAKIKRIINIILIVLSSFVGLMLTFGLVTYFMLNSVAIKTDTKVRINQNSSISTVIKTMNENDLLTPGWFYNMLARVYAFQSGKQILAGYHKFPANSTNADILNSLFSGKNLYMRKVSFPEGINIRKYAQILNNTLEINPSEFLALCRSPRILKKYDIDAETCEGYLMPATYNFFKDISAEEVINILLYDFQKLWEDKFAAKAKASGKSKHKILTMASIVEAETPVASERKRVAGVYYNRLNSNWLLQADPTVQYAINDKKRLTFADLKANNPYNTYMYKGLPPGPINSPSITSIEAAINPEDHNYFFFVAVGDGSGRHNFSKGFKDHRANIKKYKENRRNNQ